MHNHIKNALIAGGLAASLLSLSSCGKSESSASGSAAATSSAPAAPTADQMQFSETDIGFPEPMFTGTPVPAAKIDNLEPPGNPKKSFNAPKGTELLSKGKVVTSSDKAVVIPSADGLKLITDGEKDSNDGSFVELAPEPTWVQIDLEAEATIHQILVWHFHRQAVVVKDVIVQISNDPEFKTGVTTVYNADTDDSLKQGAGTDKLWVQTNHGRMIDGKATKGRYVRLWSAGNTEDDFNRYIEVSVYGQK
jgi:hypothetical protein